MATSQDSDRPPSDESDTEEHNPNIEEKKNKGRRKQPSYAPLPGTYLFDFPIDALKPGPPSAARVHIRRVLDVLHVSIGRRDSTRARRAWSILARCEEVKWRTLWRTAVHVLDMDGEGEGCAFLHRMRWDQEAESILREFILRSAQAGQVKRAYDVLDIRLHDFPYRDNPVLHIYAAFMCIYLGQQHDEVEGNGGDSAKKTVYDPASLRRAKLYLERALALDPENEGAQELMGKVNGLGLQDESDKPDGVDEDSSTAGPAAQEEEEGNTRRKKTRNE